MKKSLWAYLLFLLDCPTSRKKWGPSHAVGQSGCDHTEHVTMSIVPFLLRIQMLRIQMGLKPIPEASFKVTSDRMSLQPISESSIHMRLESTSSRTWNLDDQTTNSRSIPCLCNPILDIIAKGSLAREIWPKIRWIIWPKIHLAMGCTHDKACDCVSLCNPFWVIPKPKEVETLLQVERNTLWNNKFLQDGLFLRTEIEWSSLVQLIKSRLEEILTKKPSPNERRRGAGEFLQPNYE